MALLPFLTLPDPLVTGEGALDPLGLSMIAERLADEILPGLRAYGAAALRHRNRGIRGGL